MAFASFWKYVWACERTCTTVRVPMSAAMMRQPLPCFSRPSRKMRCSSSVQRPRFSLPASTCRASTSIAESSARAGFALAASSAELSEEEDPADMESVRSESSEPLSSDTIAATLLRTMEAGEGSCGAGAASGLPVSAGASLSYWSR